MTFGDAIHAFDAAHGGASSLPRSLCTVDGKFIDDVTIRNAKGERLEEYYKWQFIHGLIAGAGYPRDYIGAEIYLPKGNIKSAPIKIDACIFTSLDWIEAYRDYRENDNPDSLHKVRSLISTVIEFKRDGKKIEQVFNSQIKAALKEPDSDVVLGHYYDEGRLYIFRRTPEGIFRLDGDKNFPKSQRILEQYQLELTDPYYLIPSFAETLRLTSGGEIPSIKDLTVDDLDTIYTVNGDKTKTALNRVLRTLDLQSMTDDQGYMIVIHLIAAKVFDEKNSAAMKRPLRFYVEDSEKIFSSLLDDSVQEFISRISDLVSDARGFYKTVLSDDVIDWQNISHVKVAMSVVDNLQSFSFTRSRRKDLYQLIFYNFATALKKDQNAQFLTPLPIIEFLVRLVNPRRGEKILDPCCGPSDFLAVSLANEQADVRAEDLYGIDNDKKMVLLSNLNVILSGDGNAVVRHAPDLGSLTNKFDVDGGIVALNDKWHKGGKWDTWPDKTKLMKFDIVLTNPPFGKGRNLLLSNQHDRYAAEFYELYDRYVETNPKDGLDLGVAFLENAVRSIKKGGRFGIVLSNSIASNNTWQFARDWLLEHVRIVALFDLPPNVFAETGVNTTLIVGYKPSVQKISALVENDYEVFTREIHHVGYERRTSNRNIVFEDVYKLDETTFEVVMNSDGEPAKQEDFSQTVRDFREWCMFQEAELRSLFLG